MSKMVTLELPVQKIILPKSISQPLVIQAIIKEARARKERFRQTIVERGKEELYQLRMWRKSEFDIVHNQWHTQQSFNQLLVAIAATQAAVTASGVATDLVPYGDYTFPANWFQIGTHIRITAMGIISTTTGSNTMTFSVQMGATTINAAFGAITLIASQTNQKFKLVIDIECRALGNGTVTTFLCQGVFQCSPALLAAGNQMLPASGAAAVGTGVDWTATQQLKLMGTWSAVSNSITIEQYYVEQLN